MRKQLILMGLCGVLGGCAADATGTSKEPLSAAPSWLSEDTKRDSAESPTVVGSLFVGGGLRDDLTPESGYHAWTYTPDRDYLIKLNVTSTNADMVMLVQQHVGSNWTQVALNDDCNSATRDACASVRFTANTEYRVIVTTYQGWEYAMPTYAQYWINGLCAGGCGVQCGPQLPKCPSGQFCDYVDDSCGENWQAIGFCTAAPNFCLADLTTPVCACDGETFQSACFAQRAGHDIAADDRCQPRGFAGDSCGLATDPPCATGLFCDVSGNDFSYEGVCSAEIRGVCATPPAFRACSTRYYRPVCGCDGQTYRTDCFRNRANVAKAHSGDCNAPAEF